MNQKTVKLFAAALLLASGASALAEVCYVDVNCTNATPPYTNWTTAARSIYAAMDAAVAGDEIVVTNGHYAAMAVYKPLNIRSVNGPQFTIIDGGGWRRCVELPNGASLSGFTLTNGLTHYYGPPYYYAGAGVACYVGNAAVSNCVITGNRVLGDNVYTMEVLGGGAYGVTLNNCTLTGNSVSAILDSVAGGAFFIEAKGGGAAYCTLNNCTLSGNSANVTRIDAPDWMVAEVDGGGAYSCTLNNCVLSGNFGALYDCGVSHNCNLVFNYEYEESMSAVNSCWMGDPRFVDQASGNFRLQSNSPCINAGLNAFAPAGPDLDGNPRIAGGTVDIGAYEFQSPASTISYAWLQQFNLPIDPATDSADPDGDGVDNYHEWLSGTYPTNRFSSPAQLTIIPSSANVVVTWSTNAVGFTLQSTTNLTSPAAWSTNSPAPFVSNGQNTVTNPISGSQQFYRLSQ
jgi:hypothetical protein